MNVPELTVQQSILALRAWVERIIHEDGDRDGGAGSNLTVEQTIGAAKIMLATIRSLENCHAHR
jgi:hypothetical protein